MEFTKNEIFFNGEVFEPVWEERKKECKGSIKISKIELSEEDIFAMATNAPNY